MSDLLNRIADSARKAVKPFWMKGTGAWQRKAGIVEFIRIDNGAITDHVVMDAVTGEFADAPADFNMLPAFGMEYSDVALARLGFRRTGSVPNEIREYAGEVVQSMEGANEEVQPRSRKRGKHNEVIEENAI